MMNDREIDMALERRENFFVERQQMCTKLMGGPIYDCNQESLMFAQGPIVFHYVDRFWMLNH
jgi:hypothetical protein